MRVEHLVARHGLPSETVSRFTLLLERLATARAPTTVHDTKAAVEVHLADALCGLEVPEVREAGTLADLGSGAGIPGLVLAAVLPACAVTLVESVVRKAEFIAGTASAMGLHNVTVVADRAESWNAGLDACDVVTARALAALPVLEEYAAPLLRPGGVLVAWKGAMEPDELVDAAAAAAELGLGPPDVRPVRPYPGSRNHRLVVVRKTGHTPPRYPRRPGMAVKRPLGARRVSGR